VLNWNQGLILERLAVCEGEGRGLDWAIKRSPDVDDADAVFKESLSFGGQVVVHPRSGRLPGLIDMDSRDWLPVTCCATDGVVEKQDALGARSVLKE